MSLAKIWHGVKRVFERLAEDRLSLVAAGVAFYIFLSLFPAVACVISLYGLFANAEDVRSHMDSFSQLLPGDVLSLIEAQVVRFSESEQQKLGLGLLVGIAVSLWSANKAMKAIAQALNIAHNLHEDRHFVKVNLITLALTFTSSLAFSFTLGVLIIIPVLVSAFLSRGTLEWVLLGFSWSILIAMIFAIFMTLYRKAPALHNRIAYRHLVPGAVTATSLLVVGSVGFSFYVANFGKYDAQYGTLASVVITMLWLYIGAFIFLLGAEINAVLASHRQGRDDAKNRVSAADA